MYATEILPTMLRSKGIAIYAFVQAITVTYNQYVNPIAIAAIQWKYYFLFLALQVVLFICAYFTFMETKVCKRDMANAQRLKSDIYRDVRWKRLVRSSMGRRQ